MSEFNFVMNKTILELSVAKSYKEVDGIFLNSLYVLNEARLRDLGLSKLTRKAAEIACSLGAGKLFVPKLIDALSKPIIIKDQLNDNA